MPEDTEGLSASGVDQAMNRLDIRRLALQELAMNIVRGTGAVVGLWVVVIAGCSEKPSEKNLPAPEQSASIHIFEVKQDTSPREPCTGPPVVGISIFSLYASPLTYSGKIVDVIGFITWIDLQPVLFSSEDYARARMTMMGIVLDDTEIVRNACADSPKRGPTGTGCDDKIVAVKGCFVYDGSGYFGALKGELDIRLF